MASAQPTLPVRSGTGGRVLLADDHDLILDLFAQFLMTEGMSVSVARSLDAALAIMEAEGPFDLVLLDLQMPGMSGVPGLARAVAAAGGHPVAIMTGTSIGPRLADELLAAGASGILLKSNSARGLTVAIATLRSGALYLPRELMSGRDRTDASLTPRETAVLSCLAEGRQNKEIAFSLGLAEPTVKMHVKAICRKLGAQNRTHAVVMARDIGLV